MPFKQCLIPFRKTLLYCLVSWADYIGVHCLRGKKPPIEIRQAGITYDPNLPYLEISQYSLALIRQAGITYDPNLPYLEISQYTLTFIRQAGITYDPNLPYMEISQYTLNTSQHMIL
jgi:hypothetical protein